MRSRTEARPRVQQARDKRTVRQRRLPQVQRAATILDAAYEQFAARGYDGVSMTDLAARVGVTKPILYRHFTDKDALCAACAWRFAETMIVAVREATTPDLPADGQLWAGIVAQLRFIESHRDEWRVYVREAPLRGGVSARTLAKGRAAVISMLNDVIRQAIETSGRKPPPELELDAQAHALQGAVEQVASWWEAHPEQALELVALRVMNFAWAGFGDMLAGRLWAPPA